MGLVRVMTKYADRDASYLFATALDAHSSLTHLNQRLLLESSWPASNDRWEGALPSGSTGAGELTGNIC